MKRLLFLFILGSVLSGAFAQVRVYPTFVAINPTSPVGNIVVENPASTSVEVRLSFVFAYERIDPVTGSQVLIKDSTGTHPGSLTPYVKVFPQRFVLPPGGSQEVRILSRVPAATGKLLWTKLSAESLEQIRVSSQGAGVNASVRMILSQLIPVYFTGMRATTDLEVLNFGREEKDGIPILSARFQRTGENPFVGTIMLRVEDDKGKEVVSVSRSIAIFYDSIEQFDLNSLNLPTGRYTAHLTLEPTRNAPKASFAAMAPLKSSVSFSL